MVEIARFWVPGHPNSNHRARGGKYGFYMDDQYKAWCTSVGWMARAAQVPYYEDRVILSLIVYTKSHAKQDFDNLEKGVAEGLQGVAYKDDVQVYESYTRKMPPHPQKGEGVQVVIIPSWRAAGLFTENEARLLGIFLTRLGQAVTRILIESQLWESADYPPNAIHNLVSRLRSKGIPLRTVKGVGYALDEYPEQLKEA